MAPPDQSPLAEAIAERERYGMNTDPAYVRSLLDRGRTFTAAEQRWIKRAQQVDFQDRVEDYLQRHRLDWGGTTIVAHYPAEPYLLVRLLRHEARHARALRRLSPSPIRFAHSTYQRDWFYTLPLEIGDDAGWFDGFLDGFGRAGFYVSQAEGHEGTQSVDVDIYTTRTDAQAYFTRLYGPIVHVHVLGDRFECRFGTL